MALIQVARLSDLPPESVLEVMVDGRPYAICRTGGAVTAIDGVCAHRGGPLGQGQIHEGSVICPYHLWEFDCRSGECLFNPAKSVAAYEVTVEGDNIFLQVPDARTA